MKKNKVHQFFLFAKQSRQPIFSFLKNIFFQNTSNPHDDGDDREIKLVEYILEENVSNKKLTEEILCRTEFLSEKSFFKLCGSISFADILTRDGFSNIFPIRNELGLVGLVTIKIDSNWNIGTDGFVIIRSFNYIVDIPKDVNLWHKGNRVFVLGD